MHSEQLLVVSRLHKHCFIPLLFHPLFTVLRYASFFFFLRQQLASHWGFYFSNLRYKHYLEPRF